MFYFQLFSILEYRTFIRGCLIIYFNRLRIAAANLGGIGVSKFMSFFVMGWANLNVCAWRARRCSGLVRAPYLRSPAIGCPRSWA